MKSSSTPTGFQKSRGLFDFMIDEMTLLKLCQDTVESELARSEVGCPDIRIVHVWCANRGAVARFWGRALLLEKKGAKAHS